jgi:hypothetical protein
MDDINKCVMCEVNDAGPDRICDECWNDMHANNPSRSEGRDVR